MPKQFRVTMTVPATKLADLMVDWTDQVESVETAQPLVNGEAPPKKKKTVTRTGVRGGTVIKVIKGVKGLKGTEKRAYDIALKMLPKFTRNDLVAAVTKNFRETGEWKETSAQPAVSALLVKKHLVKA